MMETLSDKGFCAVCHVDRKWYRRGNGSCEECSFHYYQTDVKQFIKDLKEEMSKVNIADGYGFTHFCEKLKKLAGKELSEVEG